MLLTLDRLAPAAAALRSGTNLETIIITALSEYSPEAKPPAAIAQTIRLADLLDESTRIDLPRIEIDPEQDVAVLRYTGGTTGVPKAAMLTHRNIFANTIQTELWHARSTERGRDRFLLVIPYFHIYGLTVGMMRGLWQGARQILIPKYDVEAVLAALRDYQPTYFPAVPTIFVSLLNHPRLHEFNLDRVCTYNSGSAPIALEVLERFERIVNVPLNQGYGLSEASPVTHSTAHLAKRKPASIGLPMPDTDMKIVDLETGTRELPFGEEGELCVAGPQIMKGYWNKPEETAIALRADEAGVVWLHTGDVARIDEDGFTFIVQRKKDMIIVDGFNVYPSEVEGALVFASGGDGGGGDWRAAFVSRGSRQGVRGLESQSVGERRRAEGALRVAARGVQASTHDRDSRQLAQVDRRQGPVHEAARRGDRPTCLSRRHEPANFVNASSRSVTTTSTRTNRCSTRRSSASAGRWRRLSRN